MPVRYGGFVLGSGFQAFCENPFPNETVVAERVRALLPASLPTSSVF